MVSRTSNYPSAVSAPSSSSFINGGWNNSNNNELNTNIPSNGNGKDEGLSPNTTLLRHHNHNNQQQSASPNVNIALNNINDHSCSLISSSTSSATSPFPPLVHSPRNHSLALGGF